MANVVDFSQLNNPVNPLTTFLDPIAAEVTRQANEADKDRRLRLELAQKQAVSDRIQKTAEAKDAREAEAQRLSEQRLVGDQTQRNSRDEEATNELVRHDIANNDMGRAQQRAGAFSRVDPTTGKVVKGLPGFSAQRAVEKPATEDMPLYGPRADQDTLENAAVLTAGQQTPPAGPMGELQMGGGDVRGEFGKLRKSADQFEARNTPDKDANLAAYQQNPTDSVTIGGVKTTPDELRYTESRADSADFASVGKVLMQQHADAIHMGNGPLMASTQRQLDTYSELAPQVEKGLIKPRDAVNLVNSTHAGEYKRQAANEHDVTQGEYGLEGRRISGQALVDASKAKGATTGQNLDLKERQEKSKNLRKDRDALITRFNAKTTQEAAQEFPNITKMLDSGNGKLQAQALITMMRLAQKDNRFSDADAKLAFNNGAGWLDQVENYVNKGMTGSFAPEVVGIARQAAQRLNGFYQDKSKAMNEAADSFLEQPDYYDSKEAAQLLARDLPGFKERHPDFFPKAASAQGGARVDPSNPDDPNAPDAGRPLDGEDVAPVQAAPRITRDEALKEAQRRGLIK